LWLDIPPGGRITIHDAGMLYEPNLSRRFAGWHRQLVGFLGVGLVATFVLRKQTFGVPSTGSFLPGIRRAILGG